MREQLHVKSKQMYEYAGHILKTKQMRMNSGPNQLRVLERVELQCHSRTLVPLQGTKNEARSKMNEMKAEKEVDDDEEGSRGSTARRGLRRR